MAGVDSNKPEKKQVREKCGREFTVPHSFVSTKCGVCDSNDTERYGAFLILAVVVVLAILYWLGAF